MPDLPIFTALGLEVLGAVTLARSRSRIEKFKDLVHVGIENVEQLLRDLRPCSLRFLVPTGYPLHTRFVGDEFRSMMMLE
jgi:hypothetical protein